MFSFKVFFFYFGSGPAEYSGSLSSKNTFSIPLKFWESEQDLIRTWYFGLKLVKNIYLPCPGDNQELKRLKKEKQKSFQPPQLDFLSLKGK